MHTRPRKAAIVGACVVAWLIAAHLVGFWTPNTGPSVLPCYTCTIDT